MPSLNTRHLVNADLLDLVDRLPAIVLTDELLPMVRASFGANISKEEDPVVLGAVEVTRRMAPCRSGQPDVGVTLHVPKAAPVPRGAILHMHGGGYVSGDAHTLAPVYRRLAGELDCVIASVNYRLAPETKFPGAIEDCYAALAWLNGEADALGVDRARIGVMGESAGGGLAASLALLARDRGEHPLAFQHLVYPMLDDRTCAAPPHPYAGEFIWTAQSNRFGWRSLLGEEPGGPDVSPYAAAARAPSLSGLPPAFINTGALDLFIDEDIAYAQRLIRDGVQTELHVYPGAYHGFHFVADAFVTRRALLDSTDALRRALQPTPRSD